MSTASFHPAAFTLQGMFTLANETERELARNLELNLTDFRALSVLAQLGPVTVGKLAAELGATPATTTAIVSRLVSRGYVARHRGTGDRRQVHVSATPAAARKITTLMQPLVNATNEHIQALPASQQSVVADFLDVAQHLMRDHLHTLSTNDAP
ncbi:MarR family winged helix-turn-helix transcriptional regulator [Pseudarthrobacter sp. ATCC 49987]|uniref:MarR family winged helix-turn-helix transcriptional regulator n=1 Tax=Pseudarthrobacter sp. ATCC 49987 TaxID=2698204 RepID=UPI001372296D|nr:MarR family transcriptional regulator [Pseudarthrobacter sp. ATCC 49987]